MTPGVFNLKYLNFYWVKSQKCTCTYIHVLTEYEFSEKTTNTDEYRQLSKM